MSHIDKKIKVFSRRGKVGYRLLFSGLLCFTDVKSARDYNAYCVSNRNNQILYAIIQKMGLCFIIYLIFLTIHSLTDKIILKTKHQNYTLMNKEKNST